MTQELWSAVDRYINDLFEPPDAALTAALQASSAAGLRPINVSPNQGHFLQLLARARGARSEVTARSGWRGRCPPEAV
jgi:predicted O-methyltransferase YrrM